MKPIAADGRGARHGECTLVGFRRRIAFWVAGITLTLFFSAASAPSPLYAVYQSELGFSATVLTAIFAVCAVALLVTLLPAGEVSDQIGRRPVIICGLALQMAAMALSLVAGELVEHAASPLHTRHVNGRSASDRTRGGTRARTSRKENQC